MIEITVDLTPILEVCTVVADAFFFFFLLFFFMHSFSRFALLPEFDVSKVSWSQTEHKKLSSVYRPEKKPDYFIFVTAFVYLFIILLLLCGVKF